jgi:hypothetical protein
MICKKGKIKPLDQDNSAIKTTFIRNTKLIQSDNNELLLPALV